MSPTATTRTGRSEEVIFWDGLDKIPDVPKECLNKGVSKGSAFAVKQVSRTEVEKKATVERRDELLRDYLNVSPGGGYKKFLSKLLEFFNSIVSSKAERQQLERAKKDEMSDLLMVEIQCKVSEVCKNDENLNGVLSYLSPGQNLPNPVFAGYAAQVCANLLARVDDTPSVPYAKVQKNDVTEVIKEVVDRAVENLRESDRLIQQELAKHPELKPTNGERARLLQEVMGNPASAAQRVREFKEEVMLRTNYHQEFFGDASEALSVGTGLSSSDDSLTKVDYSLMNTVDETELSIQLPRTGQRVYSEQDRSAIARNLQAYIENADARDEGVLSTGLESTRSSNGSVKHSFGSIDGSEAVELAGANAEEKLNDFRVKIAKNMGAEFSSPDKKRVAADCQIALEQQGVIAAALTASQDVAESLRNGQYFVSPSGMSNGEYRTIKGSSPNIAYIITELSNQNSLGLQISGRVAGRTILGHARRADIQTAEGGVIQAADSAKVGVVLKLTYHDDNPIPKIDCIYAASKYDAENKAPEGKQIFSFTEFKNNELVQGELALSESGSWKLTSDGERCVTESLMNRIPPFREGASAAADVSNPDLEPFKADLVRSRYEFEYRDGHKEIIHCAEIKQTSEHAMKDYWDYVTAYFPHWSPEEKARLVEISMILENQGAMGAAVRTDDAKIGATFSASNFALALGGFTRFNISPGSHDHELVYTTTVTTKPDCKDAIVNGPSGIRQLFTADPNLSIEGGWTGRIKLDFSKDRKNPVIRGEGTDGNWKVLRTQ